MKYKLIYASAFFVLFLSVGFFADSPVESAGASIPPWPVIYTGDVTVAGQPAKDGMVLVGKMEGYSSVPLVIEEGRMRGLTVGPPDNSFFGKTITFELEGMVLAAETDVFLNYGTPFLKKDFHLTFPAIPTPTPLPTATPLPTSTPLPATATPIVVGPVVFNGLVVASGGVVPEGAMLTARIGSYESQAVPVVNGAFISLIIDLNDPGLTNSVIKFYLDGVESRTTGVYSVGATIRDIDLIFMDLPRPDPTAFPTSAPVPVPVMPTPIPTAIPTAEPAVVPAPVVATAEKPVASVIEQPSATPVVLVVTATSEPLLEVEPDQNGGGGCFSVSDVDPLTGAGNVLAMIGPILLLVGYRGIRRWM